MAAPNKLSKKYSNTLRSAATQSEFIPLLVGSALHKDWHRT